MAPCSAMVHGGEPPSIPWLGENLVWWQGGQEHGDLVGNGMEGRDESSRHHGMLSDCEGSIVCEELHEGHLVLLVHDLLDEDGVECLLVLPLLLCFCLPIRRDGDGVVRNPMTM
ncbi:hypothetical protein GUJ93_ZPchr0005g14854 [Zizania palustris]|uniref:Uncharacterized protein n=1 Tax=Zizania palustris TaxID=103762 RepID=A0A8J5W192_ZIZPA|nr:hypothetical protein GUJ93_ZPchr0005g14854 [Zizania palustris]